MDIAQTTPALSPFQKEIVHHMAHASLSDTRTDDHDPIPSGIGDLARKLGLGGETSTVLAAMKELEAWGIVTPVTRGDPRFYNLTREGLIAGGLPG